MLSDTVMKACQTHSLISPRLWLNFINRLFYPLHIAGGIIFYRAERYLTHGLATYTVYYVEGECNKRAGEQKGSFCPIRRFSW